MHVLTVKSQRYPNGDIMARLLIIDSLISMFLHFEAADPRDLSSALLRLASDAYCRGDPPGNQKAIGLQADYFQCAHQIYARFVQYVATRADSLDIIWTYWAPQTGNGQCGRLRTKSGHCLMDALPSWIRLALNSPYGPPSKMTGRLNGDSLVGSRGRRIYYASENAKPNFGIEAGPFSCGELLG